MDYNIETGLLKENSLNAKIYFLLLKRELSVSEISKVIYRNNKVQLSNILKAIEKLTKEGYVVEVLLSNLEKEKRGMDKKTKPYKSTYKPLLEFIEKKVKYRVNTSHAKKEVLTSKDKQVLELIFKSRWFSKFYSEEFLLTQIGEINKAENGEILSHCPIRFFAFFLEELFEIAFLLKQLTSSKVSDQDIINSNDFDKFIEDNKDKFNKKIIQKLHKINSVAVKHLGYYKEKSAFDYYTEDIGILFIPINLAQKLQSIGRVPLTVADYFQYAIKTVLKK